MNGRYVNITIYGGTIDATGGSDASAIGGTRTAYNDYSQIEIHGGAITAKASSRARGAIAGTSVLLDGGVITAQGTGCPGVSSGVNGAGIYIKNDVVVFASGSCGIDGYQEQPGWNGLVFENGAGRVYGTVAPPKDFEIPDGYTIDLPEGSEPTLPANTSLPSNITLTGSGTLYPEEKRSIPQVSIEHNW